MLRRSDLLGKTNPIPPEPRPRGRALLLYSGNRCSRKPPFRRKFRRGPSPLATTPRVKTPRVVVGARGVIRDHASRDRDQAVANLALLLAVPDAAPHSTLLATHLPAAFSTAATGHKLSWSFRSGGRRMSLPIPGSSWRFGKAAILLGPGAILKRRIDDVGRFAGISRPSRPGIHAAVCSRAGPTVQLPSSDSSMTLSWKSRRYDWSPTLM